MPSPSTMRTAWTFALILALCTDAGAQASMRRVADAAGRQVELPEYGRLTGRGGTANLENVLKFKPDLIIDSGSTNPSYVSLANTVQEQTKIPYLLLDGRLDKTPASYRMLGQLLGSKDRAERLAAYAEETLNGLSARLASIPDSARP